MTEARKIIDKNGRLTTVHVNPAKNVKQGPLARLFGIKPRVRKVTDLSAHDASRITSAVNSLKAGFFADEQAATQFFLDLQNADAFDVREKYNEQSLRIESTDGRAALYVYYKNGRVWDMSMTDLTQFTDRDNYTEPSEEFVRDNLAVIELVRLRLRNL